jgi:basic membrane protein A and related proteins
VKRTFVALALTGAVALGGLSATALGGTQRAAATSDYKVGLVTDIGGLNDHGFNFLANKGLEMAKAKLGIKTSVLQSSTAADYVPNITRLIAQGNKLIVTNGFLMAAVTAQMAKKFPNVQFAIIDVSTTDPQYKGLKNVRGLIFKEQEAGYLAGYLSGLFEQTKARGLNGKGIIGSVGGQKIPPVDHYIAGFQAGAKKADPSIKTLNAYSNTFVNTQGCAEQALAQIGQGSDIEFQVAGTCGLGALSAAKDKKVWGIGVDADQSYLGKHILTSAMKRVDLAVEESATLAAQGKFKGGDRLFSLKDNGVALGKINPVVPKAIVAKVKKVEAQIKAGKVTIPNTV